MVVDGAPLGAQTSSKGDFIIHDVPRTSTFIIARSIGYQPMRTSVLSLRGDTAHVSLMLKATNQSLEAMTVQSALASAPASPPVTPVETCALRTVSATGVTPLFRALVGNVDGVGAHQLTLVGWPAPNDSLVVSFTRQLSDNASGMLSGKSSGKLSEKSSEKLSDRLADKLSGHAARNGALLDLQLTQDGVNWNGQIEERRGTATRTVPIFLTPDRSAVCSK